jgi:hypothetical protein
MPMCTQHAMIVSSNTSAGVSNIAQLPDGQKRQVKIIDTPSQSVRSSQVVPEPNRVSVASLRNIRANPPLWTPAMRPVTLE